MFSKVEALLRGEDVEGLMTVGAPDDEYASETVAIAAAIDKLPQNNRTVDSIMAIIAFVWAKSFNCDDAGIKQRLPAFRRIAQGVLEYQGTMI